MHFHEESGKSAVYYHEGAEFVGKRFYEENNSSASITNVELNFECT
jgi:hypothetical protein